VIPRDYITEWRHAHRGPTNDETNLEGRIGRATGPGWQTRMDNALKRYVATQRR
jgi:hypothetical protein